MTTLSKLVNPAKVKLGRKAIKTDTRTLKLSDYLTPALPAPPPTSNWTKNITSFGVMLNDTLGDCTIAGCGHAIQIWSANAYSEVTVPDSAILAAYEKWDGYVNGDPSTDNGGIELNVLNDWRKYGLDGHHILGYADPNSNNITEIKQSIAFFGGVYIGMQVPNFIMSGSGIPKLWDVVANDGGIDGGHCVFVCGYDTDTITFISWGSVYQMTIPYWNKYVDEAHTILSASWIKAGKAPSGFALTQLQADLALLK